MKRRNIITNSREIYEKFNLLNFSPEILLKNVKPIQVQKIVRTINQKNQILDMEVIGQYIVVKKIAPLNFNMYFR